VRPRQLNRYTAPLLKTDNRHGGLVVEVANIARDEIGRLL
jgi:hypothetical protein